MVTIESATDLALLMPAILNSNTTSRLFDCRTFSFSKKSVAQEMIRLGQGRKMIDGHAFPDIGGAGVRLYEIKKDNHLEYTVVEFEKGLMLEVFTFDNLEDAIAKKIEVWTVSYEMKFSEN